MKPASYHQLPDFAQITAHLDNHFLKLLTAAATVLLMVASFLTGREIALNTSIDTTDTYPITNTASAQYCVVIDAGHGGEDPGKIGINNAREKDINLNIAGLVKEYLEMNDIQVIMTRTSDAGLHDPGTDNKKVQDMKRRLDIIEHARPDAVVSIHQNSYPEEYVHGAQVFYYTGSTSGQKLAEKLQEQFLKKVDPENTRQIKGNDSYYLLKKTSVPLVIAECGFLSNRSEAEMLCSEAYQKKLAWAIHMGIVQYLND